MAGKIAGENRYQKQKLLFGNKKQKLLEKKKVAVVGLGALGSICAELLTRSGVGKILLIDRDIVSLSNLQRQHLYDEADLTEAKSAVCSRKLKMINSQIKINGIVADVTFRNIVKLLLKIDCIIDCTDNLFTRLLLNDYCIKFNKTLIHGAVVGQKGSLFVVHSKKKIRKNIRKNDKERKMELACLACLYDEKQSHETCETIGVMNTASSIIGSLQAQECLKLLIGEKYEKNFIRFDFATNQIIKVNASVRKNCRVCQRRKFTYLLGEEKEKKTTYCGAFSYQIKNFSRNKFSEFKKRLNKTGKIIDLDYCFYFGKIIIFIDGRVLIKTNNETEARQLYSKYIGN